MTALRLRHVHWFDERAGVVGSKQMKEGDEADTPERRILDLREWVKSNYRLLLDATLVAHPTATWTSEWPTTTTV